MKRPHWLKLSPSVVFGLVAVGVLGLGWVVIYLPQLQTAPLSQKIKGYETSAKPDPEKLATLEKGRIDTENAIRTGLIQGLGGTAVLIGIYFTYRNLRTAEANLEATQDKQVTERFGKAVEMLSNNKSMHTRLGGIYALERIAQDSNRDHWTIMEVLTAFVREQSLLEKTTRLSTTPSAVSNDVQAALTVIGRRNVANDFKAKQLDLSRSNLSHADLSHADLSHANLIGADLSHADLSNADLTHANLEGADIRGADLKGADLKGADLKGARFYWGHIRYDYYDYHDPYDNELDENDLEDQQEAWELKQSARANIQSAKNWKEAYYDTDICSWLELKVEPNAPA